MTERMPISPRAGVPAGSQPAAPPPKSSGAGQGAHNAPATAALAALALALSSGPAIGAPVKLTATLTGAAETGGGDTDGSGGFTATVDPETNDFCYSLWGDKLGKMTMAHVHVGAVGVDGGPVITLAVTGKNDDACLAIDKDKLQPIVDNPAGYYVNIHSEEFPKGAVRGQLGK